MIVYVGVCVCVCLIVRNNSVSPHTHRQSQDIPQACEYVVSACTHAHTHTNTHTGCKKMSTGWAMHSCVLLNTGEEQVETFKKKIQKRYQERATDNLDRVGHVVLSNSKT